MKRIISLILLIVFSLSIFPQEVTNPNPLMKNQQMNEIRMAEAEAIREAKSVSTTKWCCIGSAATVCCGGGFGCLGATLFAYLSSPEVPAYVYAKSPAYKSAFEAKYKSKVKQRKALSAFLAGFGTSIIVSTVLIILEITSGVLTSLSNNL